MAGDRNIKVLITTDVVGGVWTYCMELCRTLADVEFHLVTSGGKLSIAQNREAAQLENVVLYETEYKLEWMSDPWNDIDTSGAWLLQLEERIQPDLIHLNAFAYGALPFRAPKIVVAHSDVFTWWVAVKGEMPPAEWSMYYNRVKEGIEGANLLLAPSQAMLKNLKDAYNFSTKASVVYNGRNLRQFSAGPKKKFVFSMGRIWDEAKNIQLLIDAAAHMDVPVKIAGDQRFEENILEAGNSTVQLLGKLSAEHIAAHLSEAAVFALPARYEPFGLSALEAACCGCALVLGDIPSQREIWGDAALYVDVDDETALAHTISELIGDQEMLQHYQSKAINRCRRFSSDVLSKEYRLVYNNIIQQSITKKQQVV